MATQTKPTDDSRDLDLLTQLANFGYRTGDLLQSAARKAHP